MTSTMCAHHELPTDPNKEVRIGAEEIQSVKDGEPITFTCAGQPVAMLIPIDPDQAWFWTPEWLAKEREVDEEIAAGIKGRFFDTSEEFLDHLRSRMKPADE